MLGVLGGSTGLLTACHGGGHWEAPASIDNTGTENVSAALTDWLATTGEPGDWFHLRPGANGEPGRYWIPQGIRIGKPMLFDLQGACLFSGEELGPTDPELDENRVLFPPLYGEPVDLWPRHRRHVLVSASQVTIVSSLPGARIQGAGRMAALRAGRLHVPSGIAYNADFEGQHAIQLGERDRPCTDTRIDLANIALEFPMGDGISISRDAQRIHIHGQRLGRDIVGGPRDPQDGDYLGPEPGGLGGMYDDTLGRWEPAPDAYPGIHHTGRQGIALAFRMSDILIEDISVWRTGRTAFDFEPHPNETVSGATVRRTETGVHHLGWVTAASGPCEDITIEDNVCYERLPVIVRAASNSRHRNWRLLNNWGGLRTRGQAVVELTRVDGAEVSGNLHHIRDDATPIDVVDSTGVVIGDNEWPISPTPVPPADAPPPWGPIP